MAPDMSRWVGRVALVTGASAGIGAAICKELVKHGMKVVGCARRVHRIEKLAKELEEGPGLIMPIKCDLSKEEDIQSMFELIKQRWGGIDVCINNAGFAKLETLLSGSWSSWQEVFSVNVLALLLCQKLSIESMRERGVDDGHIININSVY
ncbi:unnamed protein product, partial [Cyprideis torosa]